MWRSPPPVRPRRVGNQIALQKTQRNQMSVSGRKPTSTELTGMAAVAPIANIAIGSIDVSS